MGEFLVGTDNWFSCGKSFHKVRDCSVLKAKGRESNQFQVSSPSSNAPKKNRFYPLRSRGDEEDSPDVVTGMLQVFSINVYNVLEISVTLSFITPLVDMKFNMLLDVLREPFLVTTPVVTML